MEIMGQKYNLCIILHPAAADCIGQLRFSGKDSAGNTDIMGRIETIIDDPTSGQETAHINFATRGYSSFNTILRLKNRSSASAPSYTADDINGIILDVYNTGNPYPRYMNFIAKSAGNTDSNIGFWTEAVGGSPTEKLRITSGGHLLPGSDNNLNLGSSAKRWANIYTGDLQLSNVSGSTDQNGESITPAGNEVDNTQGTWTIQEGLNDLFLINRINGKKYKFDLTEVS